MDPVMAIMNALLVWAWHIYWKILRSHMGRSQDVLDKAEQSRHTRDCAQRTFSRAAVVRYIPRGSQPLHQSFWACHELWVYGRRQGAGFSASGGGTKQPSQSLQGFQPETHLRGKAPQRFRTSGGCHLGGGAKTHSQLCLDSKTDRKSVRPVSTGLGLGVRAAEGCHYESTRKVGPDTPHISLCRKKMVDYVPS